MSHLLKELERGCVAKCMFSWMKSELFLTAAAVSSLSSSPSHLLRVESFVRIKSDAVSTAPFLWLQEQ